MRKRVHEPEIDYNENQPKNKPRTKMIVEFKQELCIFLSTQKQQERLTKKGKEEG